MNKVRSVEWFLNLEFQFFTSLFTLQIQFFIARIVFKSKYPIYPLNKQRLLIDLILFFS